jgi:hypothetical protein
MDEIMRSELDKVNKDEMFQVPRNYFKDLPGRIMKSVEADEESSAMLKNSWLRIRPVFLIAASVIGFIFISFVGIKFLLGDRKINTISNNEAIEYVDFYASDFDETLLIESIDELEDLNQEISVQSEIIIDYLINEGIDDLTLYNAF